MLAAAGRKTGLIMTNTRKRHTPEQVVRKLGQADRMLADGADVAAVCRELGVSEQTYWAAPVVRSGLCVSRRVPFRGCSGEHSRPG